MFICMKIPLSPRVGRTPGLEEETVVAVIHFAKLV